MGDLIVGSKWRGIYDRTYVSTITEVLQSTFQKDIHLETVNEDTGETFCWGCDSRYFLLAYEPLENLMVKKDTLVIGLTGKAQSGKTTFSDYLYSKLGKDCSALTSFAEPIKEMLKIIGVEDVDAYKTKNHPILGITSRIMMQSLGTEWGRNTVYEDIWVDIAKSKGVGKEILIISDVRFENEAKYVRDNGILIHLEGRGGIDTKHKSESGIDFLLGDFFIRNNKDKERLYSQADSLLNLLGLTEYDS